MKATHYEIGALLSAVGEVMRAYDVCAGAAADGDNDDLMVHVMDRYGVPEQRARELCRVDLTQAVEHINIDL